MVRYIHMEDTTQRKTCKGSSRGRVTSSPVVVVDDGSGGGVGDEGREEG